MELPVLAFRRNRGRAFIRIIMMVALEAMCYVLIGKRISFLASVVLVLPGLCVLSYLLYHLIINPVVIELNSNGFKHEQTLYDWNSIKCYSILITEDEGFKDYYLNLTVMGWYADQEIHLNKITGYESFHEVFAPYAAAFGVEFKGITGE